MSVTTCEIHGCGMPFARAIDGVGLCGIHACEALALNIARTNAACAYDERIPSRDYKTRAHCVRAYLANVIDTAHEYKLSEPHTRLALTLYRDTCRKIAHEQAEQRKLQAKVDAMPKRKVGRPRKPVADRKGTIVRVRVKPAVIAELTRRADAAGVKVSELVGDLVNTFVAVADASEREAPSA